MERALRGLLHLRGRPGHLLPHRFVTDPTARSLSGLIALGYRGRSNFEALPPPCLSVEDPRCVSGVGQNIALHASSIWEEGREEEGEGKGDV